MKNTDQIKGRVKEAAGDLTNNDDMKRDGQVDRFAGKAKEVVGDAKEKMESAVDAVKDRVHELSSRDR